MSRFGCFFLLERWNEKRTIKINSRNEDRLFNSAQTKVSSPLIISTRWSKLRERTNERTKKSIYTQKWNDRRNNIGGRCERIANAFENEASGQMLEYHNTFEALRISHMQSKQPINNKYRVGTHTHVNFFSGLVLGYRYMIATPQLMVVHQLKRQTQFSTAITGIGYYQCVVFCFVCFRMVACALCVHISCASVSECARFILSL